MSDCKTCGDPFKPMNGFWIGESVFCCETCAGNYYEDSESIEEVFADKQKKLKQELHEVIRLEGIFKGGHKWHESRVRAEDKYLKAAKKYNKKVRKLNKRINKYNETQNEN